MNLISAWQKARDYQEIKLTVNRNGINSLISVVKRGSFANAVRQLIGHISDAELLSDGWSL